jgi:hypothetical protein
MGIAPMYIFGNSSKALSRAVDQFVAAKAVNLWPRKSQIETSSQTAKFVTSKAFPGAVDQFVF